MKRFVIPGAVLAAAVGLILLLVYGVSSHADTASLDYKVAHGDFPRAPGYFDKLPLLGTDRTADLASFRDRVVVLNIYASWCPDCHDEARLLVREQRVLARHDATLVGMTYEDNPSATASFDREYGVRYPVLENADTELVHSFGTFLVPETFVIGRDGRIEAIHRIPVTQQWFNQTVLPLLKHPPTADRRRTERADRT